MADRMDPTPIEPRRAMYPADGDLRTEVRATRRRWNFGRYDYHVTPVRGDGARWVQGPRLEFLDDDNSTPEEVDNE